MKDENESTFTILFKKSKHGNLYHIKSIIIFQFFTFERKSGFQQEQKKKKKKKPGVGLIK